VTRTYPLQPRWTLTIFGSLFFGVCAAFFVHSALTADRGVDINGIVELGVGGARVFYWVLAFLSACFVVVAIAAAVFYRGGTRAIVLDDDAIALPGPMWRPAPRRIAYADIVSLQRQDISGQTLLQIVHRGGKAGIARSLTGDTAFDEIVAALQGRVRR
jgi:hypothetical protein